MGVRRGIDRKKVGCISLIDANLEGQVGVNKFELYNIVLKMITNTDNTQWRAQSIKSRDETIRSSHDTIRIDTKGDDMVIFDTIRHG